MARTPDRGVRGHPVKGVVKLLLLFGVLLGGLAIADVVIEQIAERRAETRVEAQVGVPAEVDLRGWPVGLRLLATGDIEHAVITAEDVPLDDARSPVQVERVRVDVFDVDASLGRIGNESSAPPTAQRGTFEAHVTAGATRHLGAFPQVVGSVRIADGAIRLTVLGQEVASDVRVRDGRLLIVPRSPLGALLARRIPMDLSRFPGEPRITDAEIEGSTLVLRGDLEDLELSQAPS